MSASRLCEASPDPAAAGTLRNFYRRLLETYGPQKWWPAQDPLEVIVGAFLTQNTSWLAVERSIAHLSTRGVMNLEGLRSIPEEELRLLIRPSGFMMRKAAAIKTFIAFLDREYGGSLPALAAQPTETVRRQLLVLPGIGPETADAILLYALEHPVIVVDEYLRRIAVRHGLAHPNAKYGDLQQLAAASFAEEPAQARREIYNEFHALVVAVGKNHCRRQPHCEGCPLNDGSDLAS